MWLKSFFSIKSQILIANVSKRSHGSLSFPGFTVPLSPRSPDLDLYVLGMWRESSWVTEDGFLVKKEWFGAPQRRACAYLYLIFSPVAQNLRCQKSTFVGLEADPVETFNWTTDKAETCDNGALCQETVLMIKAGKMRKRPLGWWGRGRGEGDYGHVNTVPPSPGQTSGAAPHPLSFPLVSQKGPGQQFWPLRAAPQTGHRQ